MSQFLASLSQQVGSLVNMYMMKHIDTGDRAVDTAVQMIVSLVVTAFLAAVMRLLSNRDSQTDGCWNRAKQRFARSHFDPLQFVPPTTTPMPRSGTPGRFGFVADFVVSDAVGVVMWFHQHHADKAYKFISPVLCPLRPEDATPTRLREELLVGSGHSLGGSIPLGEDVPVWRHIDGEFVYLSYALSSRPGGGYVHRLRSDSNIALKACAKSACVFIDGMEKAPSLATTEKTPTLRLLKTTSGVAVDVGVVSAAKTFDKLYFTDKSRILPTLALFKAGRLFPSYIPVENKLGLLLHGPPGTGKTAFLSALANFLKRNVVLVDVSKLKTKADLDKTLAMPGASTSVIFVFEEMDCMKGVAARRDAHPPPLVEASCVAATMTAMAMMMATNKEDKLLPQTADDAPPDELNLAYLLTKFDGMETAEGRCIVATTNCPDRIDPALLRPGRFGVHVHLTRATRQMMKDILAMTYNLNAKEAKALAKRVQDIEEDKWSPTELIQLSVMIPALDACLQHLKTQKPCV